MSRQIVNTFPLIQQDCDFIECKILPANEYREELILAFVYFDYVNQSLHITRDQLEQLRSVGRGERLKLQIQIAKDKFSYGLVLKSYEKIKSVQTDNK